MCVWGGGGGGGAGQVHCVPSGCHMRKHLSAVRVSAT